MCTVHIMNVFVADQMELTADDILTAADLKAIAADHSNRNNDTISRSNTNLNKINENASQYKHNNANFHNQHNRQNFQPNRINPNENSSLADTHSQGHIQVEFDGSRTKQVSKSKSRLDDGYYDETEQQVIEKGRPSMTVEEMPKIQWKKGDIIGRGAFGTVFMGLNLGNGELMAVKEVSMPNTNHINNHVKSDQYVQALEKEIAVLSRLSHKNIVRYIGTEKDLKDGFIYIFLEYVSGGSIAQLLKTFGMFDENVVKIYTKHILEGLHYLHSHRIIHRDIKGANILIDNNGVPKLADFGAATKLSDNMHNSQDPANTINTLSTNGAPKSLHGTPYWMAPEVIQQTGHGRQADIWSLGCTVIEMLTGKPPWHQFKTQVSALFHIASTNKLPHLPDHISPVARDFIKTCLHRDPRHRPNAFRLITEHPFVRDIAIDTPPEHAHDSGVINYRSQNSNPNLSSKSLFVASPAAVGEKRHQQLYHTPQKYSKSANNLQHIAHTHITTSKENNDSSNPSSDTPLTKTTYVNEVSKVSNHVSSSNEDNHDHQAATMQLSRKTTTRRSRKNSKTNPNVKHVRTSSAKRGTSDMPLLRQQISNSSSSFHHKNAHARSPGYEYTEFKRQDSDHADRRVIQQYLMDQHESHLNTLIGDFKKSYLRQHTPTNNQTRKTYRRTGSNTSNLHQKRPPSIKLQSNNREKNHRKSIHDSKV